MDVRQEREKRNLTQHDVARWLGISRAGYSKRENGQIKFTMKEAKILSEKFGASIEDLFFAN